MALSAFPFLNWTHPYSALDIGPVIIGPIEFSIGFHIGSQHELVIFKKIWSNRSSKTRWILKLCKRKDDLEQVPLWKYRVFIFNVIILFIFVTCWPNILEEATRSNLGMFC